MKLTKYQLRKQKQVQKIKQEFADRIVKRMIIENEGEIVFPKELANVMGINNSDTKDFVGFIYGVAFKTY